MNQHTPRQEARIPFLHRWLSSVTLHALVLLSGLPLFHQPPLAVPQKPVHWDVILVQSASTTHASVPLADVLQPALPKQPDRRHTVSYADRTIRHVTSSAEDFTSHTSKFEAPITPKSMSDNPAPVTSLSEAATSIPNELPPTLSRTTKSPQQMAESPNISTTQTLPRLVTAAAAAPTEESTPSADATHPLLTPTTASDFAAASAIRPDYGWLQQAIFRRLEELKRSSRPLLDQPRPLKVLIRAVVSNEGTLMDTEVMQSSGLDRIDQEAMALVQQAFPIQLDHTLNRLQIAMRIPVTYSHE